MEQFKVVHNKKTKPRNRLESIVIDYTKTLLKEPVEMTLEEVYSNVSKLIEETAKRFRQKGVWASKPRVFGRFIGSENKVEREFAIYGRGRGTYTLLIEETIPKDSSNNFKPYRD